MAFLLHKGEILTCLLLGPQVNYAFKSVVSGGGGARALQVADEGNPDG